MSWRDSDTEDKTVYKVMVNEEEQYSLCRVHEPSGRGWQDTGKVGLKADCLAYVKEVWTDMTPLSLRKKMHELARNPAPPPRLAEPAKSQRSLVDQLCEGHHPVVVGLRPEPTVQLFKEAIDRGFVHVKFTDTQGGTELGVRLNLEASDFSGASFETSKGSVHIEGSLTLNYVSVRCIADICLETLEGTGRLVKTEEGSL